MKNIKKFSKLIIILFMLVMVLSTDVFAAGITITDIVTEMDPSKSAVDPTKDSRLLRIVSQVFTVIQFVGTGISIIMIMWLGITYMLTSVEQKAEIKKKMVPILVGSVLIVSAVNIMKLIQEIVINSL